MQGSSTGITSLNNIWVYAFVYPVDPGGAGWYGQDQLVEVQSNGDWVQDSAYLGDGDHPVETGHKLRIKVAVVSASSSVPSVVARVEDIEGIIAVSDSVSLTVIR
jgi:hypothetical protein